MLFFVDEHVMPSNGTVQENGISEIDKIDCDDCTEELETQNDDDGNTNVVKQEGTDND